MDYLLLDSKIYSNDSFTRIIGGGMRVGRDFQAKIPPYIPNEGTWGLCVNDILIQLNYFLASVVYIYITYIIFICNRTKPSG